jgi:hypothetical protein
MTREQAEQEAARHNREDPERATHHWLARPAGEEWEVVKVTVPAGLNVAPVRPTTEARPRPADAPDPRPAFIRDVGGPYGV